MNLEYKITKEELDEINKNQPLQIEKENKFKLFWLKLGEFFAKGATARKWEFKITWRL